jgi:hypothetical protein
MPRSVRLLIASAILVLTVPTIASATPAWTTKYRGGWTDPSLCKDNLFNASCTVAPHSANMVPVGARPGEADWTDTETNSDMVFLRDHYAIAASYNHFRVLDISNPAAINSPSALISNTSCPGSQGDLNVFEKGDVHLLFRAQEGSHNIPNGDLRRTCETAGAGEVGVGFVGLTVVDISDLAHPKPIIGVPTCGGSHTITQYWNNVNNKLYIFSIAGGKGTSAPQWGLDCSAITVTGARIDTIEVPLDHPEDAHLLTGFIPTGGTATGCHDVNTFEELHYLLMSCAQGSLASLVDVSDIEHPVVKWTFTYPGLQTMHTGDFSWGGRYVYFNGEPGGGNAAQCEYQDDPVLYTQFILELQTGKLVGQLHVPRPQGAQTGATENCTIHEINMVPSLDRNLMAASCYTCGMMLFDLTNPRAPREIAWVDPETAPSAAAQMLPAGAPANGSGCWTGYWYNGYMYCQELAWGLHVWTTTESFKQRAVTFTELNPETTPNRFRCTVSFSGGPKRAGKAVKLTATVRVHGGAEAPSQPAKGVKVSIKAPGFFKQLTTSLAGTASVKVKASKRGKLQVSAPELENMLGCSAPAKSIARKLARR